MRRTGLSLIELTVVISIVGLVMGILIPATHRMRAQARAGVCRAHQSQLLMTFACYDTNHGRLPYGFDYLPLFIPSGGYSGDFQEDTRGWWWFNSMGLRAPRSHEEAEFLICCPAKRMEGRAMNNALVSNYGVNWSLFKTNYRRSGYPEFHGLPLSLARVRRPSEVLAIVDSTYAVISWWGAADRPPEGLGTKTREDTASIPGLSINFTRVLPEASEADALEGRHPGKSVNVGYADGHADQVSAERLLVLACEGGYLNLGLWRP